MLAHPSRFRIVLDLVLKECSRHGRVIVKKAYGNPVRYGKVRKHIMKNAIEMLVRSGHFPQTRPPDLFR